MSLRTRYSSIPYIRLQETDGRGAKMGFTKEYNERVGEAYYFLRHSSGLMIYVCPKKGFSSTYASIGTNFGSIFSHFTNDGRDIIVPDGTAHYLEHKLFESEDGDAFSKYAKTGASANAFTSFDQTCYLFSCTDRFDESLGILFDLIQSPYFTEETIAKEQGIISQEIKMYADSPDWRVMMNLLQGMYKNHPINIDIAGSVETIAKITPDILYDCYNSYYNLHQMALTVVGKATPEEVLRIADEKLRPSEKHDVSVIFPDEPYEVVTDITRVSLPVSIPTFQIGFKERCGREYATAKELVCTDILMNAFIGESSALYRRLTDNKLINSTFGHEYLEGSGYRAMMMSSESRSPELSAEMIRDAVRELHKNGISHEDFERSKRSVYGKMVSGFDSNRSIASDLMNGHFTGRNIFDYIESAANVTLEDVNSRLESQLDPDNCCLSIVDPLGE